MTSTYDLSDAIADSLTREAMRQRTGITVTRAMARSSTRRSEYPIWIVGQDQRALKLFDTEDEARSYAAELAREVTPS